MCLGCSWCIRELFLTSLLTVHSASSHRLNVLLQWTQRRWPYNTLTSNICREAEATHPPFHFSLYLFLLQLQWCVVCSFPWLWALQPHTQPDSAIFQCVSVSLPYIHTHIDKHTYTGPHAPLVLNAKQCWCIAEDRTDIWFCLLLISLKGQTKSFPSVSPVSLNTIWWSHTTVTELNKKQLFLHSRITLDL